MRTNPFVRFFASLKLAVVCLACATVLVFVGTLAQVNQGLYAVQANYFQSFFVFWQVPGTALRLPVFPGGYLVGGCLLLNLIVAYATRIGFRRVHTGLLLIHAGLVLLLVGQLWTDLAQRESVVRLEEGETKSYSESQRHTELAVADVSNPDHDQVVAIPEAKLKPGAEIRLANLPFAIKVQQFWLNSAPLRGQTNAVTPMATQGAGRNQQFVQRPPVTSTDERNVPTAVVELAGDGGSLGTWLLSDWLLAPQSVEVAGKKYELSLRLARYYKPFSITLLEARHDNYKGTDIPRNFSSRVRVRNPATGEDREVLIYMNNPLRYGGYTFYQYQMMAGEDVRQTGQKPTSTLQVVRNPGWLTPYIACVLVGLGLVVQFSTHLVGFARRRLAKAAPAAAPAGVREHRPKLKPAKALAR